jgi:hypothetical protein
MLTNVNNAISMLSAITGWISIIGIIMNLHAEKTLQDRENNPHMCKHD